MFRLMHVGSDKAIIDRPGSKFGIPNLEILFALISDFDPFDCRSGVVAAHRKTTICGFRMLIHWCRGAINFIEVVLSNIQEVRI
jgi:hypothetical protein